MLSARGRFKGSHRAEGLFLYHVIREDGSKHWNDYMVKPVTMSEGLGNETGDWVKENFTPAIRMTKFLIREGVDLRSPRAGG